MKERMRPLLNYFGGKWRIAPHIIPHFPRHDLFVEPFGGSLSVLLRKEKSKREIANDVDSELYNLYVVARDNGEELQEKLKWTPHSRQEYKLSMEPSDFPIEKARRTIVRCYFGIGDSFLHNHNAFRNSKTSSTCVAKSWNNYRKTFHLITERLQEVTFENLSYEKLFEKYDSKGSLFYLDPPYPLNTRSKKHSYREDWPEIKHLSFLGEVKKLKGKFVLSSYSNDLYESELKDFKRIEIKTMDQKNNNKIEVIWVKE